MSPTCMYSESYFCFIFLSVSPISYLSDIGTSPLYPLSLSLFFIHSSLSSTPVNVMDILWNTQIQPECVITVLYSSTTVSFVAVILYMLRLRGHSVLERVYNRVARARQKDWCLLSLGLEQGHEFLRAVQEGCDSAEGWKALRYISCDMTALHIDNSTVQNSGNYTFGLLLLFCIVRERQIPVAHRN